MSDKLANTSPFGELAERSDLSPVGLAASEATKVEQTRAFAEVVVQAELAKRFPRNMLEVFRRIEEAFENSPELVVKSKYKFRKGEEVTGYTINFARAVAECVGNIHYSFKELSNTNKQSEMLSYAWDLETNTMQTRSVIVKHQRDLKGGGTKDLNSNRDIYENNANQASRRLRDCILGVLPAAAVKKAERVVEDLLTRAFPQEKRKHYAEENVKRFKEIGVSKKDLVAKLGDKPTEMWTRDDFANLAGIYDDIQKGTATVENTFGISTQTGAEATAAKLSAKKQQTEQDNDVI
jgi:hypothetical protein